MKPSENGRFLFFKGGGTYAESRATCQTLATGQVAFSHLRGRTQYISEEPDYCEGGEQIYCMKSKCKEMRVVVNEYNVRR